MGVEVEGTGVGVGVPVGVKEGCIVGVGVDGGENPAYTMACCNTNFSPWLGTLWTQE